MNQQPPDRLLRSFERYLRATNRSERTVGNYLENLHQVEMFLRPRGVRLRDATRADLEEFLADLLARRSAATAATRYKVLRVLYRWLEEEEDAPQPDGQDAPPAPPRAAGASNSPRRAAPAAQGMRRQGLRRPPRHRAHHAATRHRRPPGRADEPHTRRPRPAPGRAAGAGQAPPRTRPALRAQDRACAGPLPAGPRAPQGCPPALAVARAAGPADGVGPGPHAGASRAGGWPARPASPPVPPHLRPPVAGRGRRRGGPDAPGRVAVTGDGGALRRLGR